MRLTTLLLRSSCKLRPSGEAYSASTDFAAEGSRQAGAAPLPLPLPLRLPLTEAEEDGIVDGDSVQQRFGQKTRGGFLNSLEGGLQGKKGTCLDHPRALCECMLRSIVRVSQRARSISSSSCSCSCSSSRCSWVQQQLRIRRSAFAASAHRACLSLLPPCSTALQPTSPTRRQHASDASSERTSAGLLLSDAHARSSPALSL